MRITRLPSRRWRAVVAVAAGTALLAGGPSLGAATAASESAFDACPEPFPVSDLREGMVATGLTVEKGNVAEPFTATVVGVLGDAIAPDLDLIIVETDSPAIQRAGGIWAGMSGSPVYAEDGRLIGAVAYGLSLAPSNVAGLTPAADMKKLLDRPDATTTTARQAKTLALPTTMQQRLMRSGAATSAEARSGMRKLPLPVAVSGLSGDRLAKFSERLQKQAPDTRTYAASSVTAGTAGSAADIFPGSNFAAALSYGDLTAAGVGTTTAVCVKNSNDYALAFGHPFLWSGASSMSVHPARAVFEQRDNTLGSYKVANPLGAVGTLDQDRLAGIRGKLGPVPTATPVTSTVTSKDPGGEQRLGTTRINLPDFVPLLSAFHLLFNLDNVGDRIGKGTAEMRWIIDGKRASGAPFKVDVKNMYASQFDIAFESIFDSFDQLSAIQENRFEDAKITGVRYTADVSSDFKQYSVTSVLIRRPNGTFAPAPTREPLPVVAGSRLNLRVVLTPYKNIGSQKNVDLSLVVPAGMAGGVGSVDVTGGPGFGAFHGDGDGDGDNGPKNFDELLAALRGLVPNNSVNATLSVEKETASGVTFRQTKARKLVDQVVVGQRSLPIMVVAAPRGLPGVVDDRVWKLRSSLSSGPPTKAFSFGNSTYRQLMGDWDGDGTASPAVFKDGTWHIRMTPTSTTSRIFKFGRAGDMPVAGDWDGDGKDDIGVFRGGRWLLRDTLSAGPPHRDFTFGSSTARPVVGDWNGNGIDTVGVFRSGEWRVRNSNSAGAPSAIFTYGKKGDVPVVGDWNRDGRDRPGLYRSGKWFVRNTLTSGSSSNFLFGGSTSRPVVWS